MSAPEAAGIARDAALEAQIDDAYLALQAAPTAAARRDAWARLRELSAQRTPARIRQMERERGLAG
jgi:hypothetical protein